MSKIITLFNHKGGVSKTTTAFNLGWKLSENNKKVLLVDLDSQANLTGIVFGLSAIDDDSIERFYSDRSNLTMRQIVKAITNGMTVDSFIDSEKDGKFFKTKIDNLFLLSGSFDIAELDSQISVALKVSAGIPSLASIPSKLTDIIKKLATQNNIDYIIYDLSPNVGGLNEISLMSSDYFIVPTTPDYFCLQAIGSLTNHIKKWHEEIEVFKSVNNLGNSISIKNTPCFIGTIQQRYRPRSGYPAKSFQKWIDRIREEVQNNLVPSLQSINKNCVVEENKIKQVLSGSDLSPYDLAHIADFNSLIAISQQLSKPIFSLTNEEIKKTGNLFGQALETMIASRNNFNNVFEELTNRVLTLTE